MYTVSLFRPDLSKQNSSTRPSVGLIILTTDITSEHDFAILSKANNLDFNQYVNRISFINPMTEQNLKAMLNNLSSVAADILPNCPLDAVVFCCTSASALIGNKAIEHAIQQGKPGTKVLTTASAVVASLKRAGHKKISILSPYSEKVSKGLIDYFQNNGLEILSLTYMDIKDDRDVAQLSFESITEAAKAAIDPSADALFISCTAMRVVEIIEDLKQELGIPVFSSNQSTFWEIINTINLE